LRREVKHRSAFSLRAQQNQQVVVFSAAERERQREGESRSRKVGKKRSQNLALGETRRKKKSFTKIAEKNRPRMKKF
jgi:hypothetical protein